MKPANDKWWASNGVLGRIFKTKGALVDAIRSINNTSALNQPMRQEDQEFLLDVLRYHHDWHAKSGAGVQHLEVRMNEGTFGSTRGLYIRRVDGSEVDISWVVALKPGGKSSHKESACAAARREILDQTLAARKEQEGGNCSLCGLPLIDKTHVDHMHPNTFDSIFSDFLLSEGIAYQDVDVADMGIYAVFADKALSKRWQEFHRDRAVLRLIHAHENLSITKVRQHGSNQPECAISGRI